MYKLKPNHVLVLRTCDGKMRGYGGFKWPKKGSVKCSDWKPTAECGNGLHGFLWGAGDGTLVNWSEDAKWLVVEVRLATLVDLDGKVKFPSGKVIYSGDRQTAVELIAKHAPLDTAIIGRSATVGDKQTVTVGYGGTANAGDWGTANAGYKGTANAGGGGKAIVGNWGTANAGYKGTANAGNWGTANAGDGGTANAGIDGTANAGVSGKAAAGRGGRISIEYWDSKDKLRLLVGYVEEKGLLPGVFYEVNNGKFVVVKNP